MCTREAVWGRHFKWVIRSTVAAAWLTGCSVGHFSEKIASSDSLSLEIGFPVRVDLAGVWTDPTSTKEYLFFADPTTRKVVSFHDPKGGTRITIPLGPALSQLADVDAISVLNMDSIWLMPAHQNRAVIIDSSGRCKSTILLDPHSTTASGDRFVFGGAAHGPFHSNGCLLLHPDFRENVNDSPLVWTPEHRLSSLMSFYDKANHAPYMVKACPGSDGTLAIQFGLDSVYSQMSDRPFRSIESNHYSTEGDSILIFSTYSDRITIADFEHLKVCRSVQVSSAFTPVGIAPPLIDQRESDSGGKNLNQRFATKGYIQGLVRDVRTGKYLVTVYHEVPWDSPPEKTKSDRSFSIIVFDKDLTHQLHEYAFTDLRYDGFCILPTRNGFYMKRHEDKQTKAGSTHTFDLFVLNEE